MRHITTSLDCEYDPPPIVMMERRRQPDRRTPWRGGRRDTDWINRPLGAWKRVAHREGRGYTWSQWLFQLLS